MKRAVSPKERSALFVSYEDADVMAVKALAAGTANEGQQRRALAFVVNRLARANELSFRPESQRESDFAEGRRFVGLQLRKLVELSVDMLLTEKQ